MLNLTPRNLRELKTQETHRLPIGHSEHMKRIKVNEVNGWPNGWEIEVELKDIKK